MDHRVIQAIFRQVEKEPFAQIFGLKLIDLDEGYSKVEMTFTPDMENIFGLAYGGALFALIDEAFETASNSHGTMAVAVNLNITYVASPEPASKLTAAAKEFSCTRKTANYDIKVVGFCLPLTYSVDALRQSLLSGGGLMHRYVDLLILAGFCFIFLALAKKRV